jgi:hypothetical protein
MERERLNFNSVGVNAVSGNVSVNPTYPYVGDPLPASNAPALITGIGTAWPPAVAGSFSGLGSNVFTSGNPFGALNEFFNIQYMACEAVCAVTRAKIKPGEPVLILDEHIISKAAFTRLLRESFEKMMLPKMETMHELSGYDS